MTRRLPFVAGAMPRHRCWPDDCS